MEEFADYIGIEKGSIVEAEVALDHPHKNLLEL